MKFNQIISLLALSTLSLSAAAFANSQPQPNQDSIELAQALVKSAQTLQGFSKYADVITDVNVIPVDEKTTRFEIHGLTLQGGDMVTGSATLKIVRTFKRPVVEMGSSVSFQSEFEVTLSGRLTGVFAIGGESTGYALQDMFGHLIELDLAKNDLLKSFEAGKHVTLTGSFKEVHGVEIPVRKVLVVTKIQ